MNITLNKVQILIFLAKLKALDLNTETLRKGKIYKIATDRAKATTPPNLLGIERKMAYANKKYHSGWMCRGVTKGLAGIKFSGSPNSQGPIMHR